MDTVALAVVLFFELGVKVIGAVASAATPASGPPYEGPLTVHDVQTATDEEAARAALEVPELLRRAQEAMERARE